MATKIYANARFGLREDTLENWVTNNPVLEKGEPAVVRDGDNGEWLKIGDGVTAFNDLPWKKGPKGDSNLGGLGKKTAEGGEIFNDYESNKAISLYSTAKGTKTIAGGKGFKILSIEKVTNIEEVACYITLDSVEGLETGMVCSAIITLAYTDFAKIVSIDAAANTISIDTYPEGATVNSESVLYIGTLAAQQSGVGTTVIGAFQSAEGDETVAIHESAHAEGRQTVANGKYSHAEGRKTKAGYAAHAEGYETSALGQNSHAEGQLTKATALNSHAEGKSTIASGGTSHAEGNNTQASGDNSHSEGINTKAGGYASHSEGLGSSATGYSSHAEGYNTIATAQGAHAEGADDTKATGYSAHAEGHGTVASAIGAHSEGSETKASGVHAHAEGRRTLAAGEDSHAEGGGTEANHNSSHASGYMTRTGRDAQTVVGQWNEVTEDALFVVGNGRYEENRKNAFEVKVDGSAVLQKQGDEDNSVVILNHLNSVIAELRNEIEALKTAQ